MALPCATRADALWKKQETVRLPTGCFPLLQILYVLTHIGYNHLQHNSSILDAAGPQTPDNVSKQTVVGRPHFVPPRQAACILCPPLLSKLVGISRSGLHVSSSCQNSR